MKYYMNDDVLTAARKRVSRIFDEFGGVAVSISGGKDSTVILKLAMDEAEKRGKLPLPVMWLDQEAEWGSTVENVKSVMYDRRVKPLWFQIPFRLSNGAGNNDDYLKVWDVNGGWIRNKDPISIKDNDLGVDRFHDVLRAIHDKYIGKNVALLYGLRAEESPSRAMASTQYAKYKEITWGGKDGSGYKFAPIYDWSYKDVWKFICDENLPYNKLYDKLFRLGVGTNEMRVSALIHETALRSLQIVQKIEPKLWEALCERVSGVHSNRGLSLDELYKAPKTLPFMFDNWVQYRDFLLDNLVESEEDKEIFRRQFLTFDRTIFAFNKKERENIWKAQIQSVLSNDLSGTKMGNFRVNMFVRNDGRKRKNCESE